MSKARTITAIRLRIGEWAAAAFSRDELYEDCEVLLKAYDSLAAELASLKSELETLSKVRKSDCAYIVQLVDELARKDEALKKIYPIASPWMPSA